MPQTREQLLIVILFVIPGFLGQWVVDRFVVRPGKSEIETILTAITASCATWAVWYPVILLVRTWTGSAYVMSLLLFLALVVTPVGGALVMSATDLRLRTRLKEFLRKRLGLQWLNPRPTAWDCVFSPGAKYWVRARLKDGTLVHGIYQQGSTAGSFVDKHDLFLLVAYDGADGKFGKRVDAPPASTFPRAASTLSSSSQRATRQFLRSRGTSMVGHKKPPQKQPPQEQPQQTPEDQTPRTRRKRTPGSRTTNRASIHGFPSRPTVRPKPTREGGA